MSTEVLHDANPLGDDDGCQGREMGGTGARMLCGLVPIAGCSLVGEDVQNGWDG